MSIWKYVKWTQKQKNYWNVKMDFGRLWQTQRITNTRKKSEGAVADGAENPGISAGKKAITRGARGILHFCSSFFLPAVATTGNNDTLGYSRRECKIILAMTAPSPPRRATGLVITKLLLAVPAIALARTE